MSLTEAEGRWDGAMMNACIELADPECFCGYHLDDGIRKATPEEIRRAREIHREVVAKAYDRDLARTFYEEEIA